MAYMECLGFVLKTVNGTSSTEKSALEQTLAGCTVPHASSVPSSTSKSVFTCPRAPSTF